MDIIFWLEFRFDVVAYVAIQHVSSLCSLSHGFIWHSVLPLDGVVLHSVIIVLLASRRSHSERNMFDYSAQLYSAEPVGVGYMNGNVSSTRRRVRFETDWVIFSDLFQRSIDYVRYGRQISYAYMYWTCLNIAHVIIRQKG